MEKKTKNDKNDFEVLNKHVTISLPKDKYYYNVHDIMKLRDCKSGVAYKIIRELNKELKEKGILYYSGKVSVKYYHERYCT